MRASDFFRPVGGSDTYVRKEIDILIEKERESGEVFGVVEYNNGDYKYNVYNRSGFISMYDLKRDEHCVKKIFLKGFKEAVIIKDDFLNCEDLHHVKDIDLSSLSNVEHIGSDFLKGLSGVKSLDMSHMTKLKTIGRFVIRQ